MAAIQHCLYPAAGYGTRFLPATKSLPKEMLPIVNKPLIHFAVEEAVNAGVHNIHFVLGRNKEPVMNYFDSNFELDQQIAGSSKENSMISIRQLMESCTFSFTRQRIIAGLGHAIYTGASLIGDNPFAVILADDLCLTATGVAASSILQQMIAAYIAHQCCVIAVEEVPIQTTHNYGIVTATAIDEDILRVDSMIEKPSNNPPSNLAIIGRYILIPEVFAVLAKQIKTTQHGEIQITDALAILAAQGKVIAVRHRGLRFDCGQVHGYAAATAHVYQHKLYIDG